MSDDDYSGDDRISNMEAYVAYASNIDGQLALLMLIALIMGLGKGGVPGFSTIAIALTIATAPEEIRSGLSYAVALQGLILTVTDVSAAWLHRRKIHWPTIVIILPFSFVGMVAGMFLDEYMTDGEARIIVGFILISILLLRIWNEVVLSSQNLIPSQDYVLTENFDVLPIHQGSKSGDCSDINTTRNIVLKVSHESDGKHELSCKDFNQSVSWGILVGLFGGAATMLTNSMGPILGIYLLSIQELSPTEYVGTSAMFFFIINLIKLPMRFYAGSLGWCMIPLATLLSLISISGVLCAKPVMLAMSEKLFVRLELTMIFIAGFKLLYQGLSTM